MDKIYKCKKEFYVEKHDEDGFLIPNEAMVIVEGGYWLSDESGSTILGGEVHLDSLDGKSWIEISKEYLNEHFEQVEP